MKFKHALCIIQCVCIIFISTGCSSLNTPVTKSESTSSSKSTSSSLPQNSELSKEQIDLDYENFSEYFYGLANYINTPIETIEDIQKLDTFYLLVITAEQYAKCNNETYAIDSEHSTYNFPAKDLQELAIKLFGAEIDLSSYIDNTYFNKAGRLCDYYDETTSAFNIVFAAKFYPISDNSGFVDCYKIKSITSEENIIRVECELGVSQGLGSTAEYFDATYTFEIFEENNLPYYRLKSLTTNQAG